MKLGEVAKMGEGRELDAPSQQGQCTSEKRLVVVDRVVWRINVYSNGLF
jgi:hypothetical protein